MYKPDRGLRLDIESLFRNFTHEIEDLSAKGEWAACISAAAHLMTICRLIGDLNSLTYDLNEERTK